jgi:hypothetical protein
MLWFVFQAASPPEIQTTLPTIFCADLGSITFSPEKTRRIDEDFEPKGYQLDDKAAQALG